MKRVLTLLLTIVMVASIGLTGCQSGDDASTETSESTASTETSESSETTKVSGSDITEIRVSWWGSETRHANTLAAIAKFEEMNPDIKIISEYQGWDGYYDKLLAQVLAGEAPDVFSCIGEWYGELLQGNALADLTGKIDVSGHNAKYVEACSVDDAMYGVNLSVNGKVIIMNKTLMNELGVEMLQAPYSWEDLAAKCVEIYEKSSGDVYGMPDFSVNMEGMGFPMFPDYAASVLGVEGPLPYDNDNYTMTQEQIESYYQFWVDLRESNGIAPADISTMNDFSANSLLLQRVVAMETNFTGSYGRFQDQTQDELVMVPYPEGPNGEAADSARPGIIMSVFEGSDKQEAAVRFLDFMTNSEEAALELKTCRGVLPTEVQRTALIAADGVMSENDVKVMEVVDQIMQRDLVDFYSGPAGNAELSRIFVDVGQEIAFGVISVSEGAEKFMEQVAELENN